MRKLLKTLAIVIAVLLLMAALIMAGLVLLVNPNRFKGDLSAHIYKSTGKVLTINGDMHWSFFPWFGIKINQATLSQSPMQGSQKILQTEKLAVHLPISSLLRGQYLPSVLEFTQLEIFASNNTPEIVNPTVVESMNPKMHAQAKNSFNQKSIPDIIIHDAKIYRNAQRAPLEINYLQTQGINDNGSPFSLRVVLNFPLKNSTQKIMAVLSSEVTLDRTNKILSIPDFILKINNINIRGNAEAKDWPNNTKFTASFSVPKQNLNPFIQSLNKNLIFADKSAFSQVSGNFSLTWQDKTLTLAPIKAQIDESMILGKLIYTNVLNPVAHFNFGIDKINVDKYAVQKQETFVSTQVVTQTTTQTNQTLVSNTVKTSSNSLDNSPNLIIEKLNNWTLRGQINIDELNKNALILKNISLPVSLQSGELNAGPLLAQAYNGNIRAVLNADFTQEIPSYHFSHNFTGLNLGEICQALWQNTVLSGEGTMNSDLNAQGFTYETLLQSLNGKIGLAVKNGNFNNINIGQALSNAAAILFRQTATVSPIQGTPFSFASATFTVKNGIASTDNLTLNSDLFSITGQGQTSLLNQAIDYRLRVRVLQNFFPQAEKLQAFLQAGIPLKVTGTIKSAEIAPDMQAIGQEAASHHLEKQIEKIGRDLQDTGKEIGKTIRSFFK